MTTEILAAVVGAVAGAAALWAVQLWTGKSQRQAAQKEGVQSKLHAHEVRIAFLELVAGFREIPPRR